MSKRRTLVDDSGNSYISRMKGISSEEQFDLFVCQLSTNDASQSKPLGRSGDDTHTVVGAVEYILSYVEETWGCPVVFYTNSFYENAEYAAMVEALQTLQTEREFFLIDLYSDEAFNAISEDERALYMEDSIHPTRAGYLLWWMPRMEQDLYEFVR